MSTPLITMRNPDPHYRWSLTGYRTIGFKPTNQHATAPAKSSLDHHSDRSTVSQRLQQRLNNPSGRAHQKPSA